MSVQLDIAPAHREWQRENIRREALKTALDYFETEAASIRKYMPSFGQAQIDGNKLIATVLDSDAAYVRQQLEAMQ